MNDNENVQCLLSNIFKYLESERDTVKSHSYNNDHLIDCSNYFINITATTGTTLESMDIIDRRIKSFIYDFIADILKDHSIQIRDVLYKNDVWMESDGSYGARYIVTVYNQNAKIRPIIGGAKAKHIAKHIEKNILPTDTKNEYCKIIRAGVPESEDYSVKYSSIIDMEMEINITGNTEHSRVLSNILQELCECGLHINRDYVFNVIDINVEHVDGSNIFVLLELDICFK